MTTVNVYIPPTPASSYEIIIDDGLINHPQKWLPKNLSFHHLVIITDHTVKKYYLNPLVEALNKLGHYPLTLSFPAGEKHKHQATKQILEEKILRKHFGRDTLCIALGGGVVGDLAGFIAATYMRGIPYIQIPTTLLAMVDSSVGGKTAIDTPQGKNLIGAFWQPKVVVADIDCLKTLPEEHLISGIVEALKMFLTNDIDSFHYLQKNMSAIFQQNKRILKTLVQRAVTIKAQVVAADETEKNLRMILNFGHTIGHALEKLTQYKLPHGYAVAYGILLECSISRELGYLGEQHYAQIENALNQLGFHVDYLKKLNITNIIRATKSDKKASEGNARYILLKQPGEVHHENGMVAHAVDEQVVRAAFRRL
ncbi:MAG: aroB [Gammaproteobacteria bacterium]|nr:aroB [Gammaproteobacteria bacterium]